MWVDLPRAGTGTAPSRAPREPPSSAHRHNIRLPLQSRGDSLDFQMSSLKIGKQVAEIVPLGTTAGARITDWYASAGETFAEGGLDAEEQRKARELMRPGVHINVADVVITLSGRIPEILGLDEIVLRPPSAQGLSTGALIGGKAYFTSEIIHGQEGFHLGRSQEPGDPYWYLSKGGPVLAKHDPKPQVDIVAYASAPRLQKDKDKAEADVLEPWQPGSLFEWWAKPHGRWQKFGPREFFLVPSKRE